LKERRVKRLAITRSRKEELIALYGEILQHSDGFITTEYKGLSVALADQLRAKLREVNGAYVITKNTLFGIALKNEDWVVPQDLLVGPVATAFSDGNKPFWLSLRSTQKPSPSLVQ
jgi:ribosomal protein L10